MRAYVGSLISYPSGQVIGSCAGFEGQASILVASEIRADSAMNDGISQMRLKLTVLGQTLLLAEAEPFCPLSSGATNPIGRLGGSGGVMSSRSASKTCLI